MCNPFVAVNNFTFSTITIILFNNWYLYKVHWEKVGSNPRATLHQSGKSTIKLNISYFVYLT